MRLSNNEQHRMLVEVFNEYNNAVIRGHFKDWEVIVGFDKHSPCKNMMLVTPNETEIKIFMPNDTTDDMYNEKYNMICVWIGDNGFPEDFDDEEVVIDYLIEKFEE